MYSIGEISKMFQLPISTLRYYDKEGLFPHLKRVNGVRQFSEIEIETLRVIDCLKKSGLEIKEIKEILLKINNLNNEISYLDTLIIKYEKEIDSPEEIINSYTINIRDRIDFLYKERAKLKNRINDIKASKKKLKLKVIITLISAICLSTSLVFNNISSIIFLLATIVGTSSIILNVLSNKKKEKEISNYSLEELDKNIEEVNNKLNKKNSETLKPLIEKKKKLSTRESMLRNDRTLKRRECVHLEREKDNKYKELLEVMEEEVKLSNNEMEGQLEIPGIKKVRNR